MVGSGRESWIEAKEAMKKHIRTVSMVTVVQTGCGD